jgi:hypothetical protein
MDSLEEDGEEISGTHHVNTAVWNDTWGPLRWKYHFKESIGSSYKFMKPSIFLKKAKILNLASKIKKLLELLSVNNLRWLNWIIVDG